MLTLLLFIACPFCRHTYHVIFGDSAQVEEWKFPCPGRYTWILFSLSHLSHFILGDSTNRILPFSPVSPLYKIHNSDLFLKKNYVYRLFMCSQREHTRIKGKGTVRIRNLSTVESEKCVLLLLLLYHTFSSSNLKHSATRVMT